MLSTDQLEYQRLFRLAFPERHRAEVKQYVRTNMGRRAKRKSSQKYKQSTKGKQRSNLWRKTDKGKLNDARHVRCRRARKRNALLPGSQWEIDQIYSRRDYWRSNGCNVEVDHIFPLGFGWHEPANLQIIYANDNARKNCNPDYKPKIIFI